MSRPLHFIWGPGGVGKTHFSIYFAFQKAPDCQLLTLDPSPRLIHLLGLKTGSIEQDVTWEERSWKVRQTSADRLFENLNAMTPASPLVKSYFHELFKGLHRFRDYLSLIDLSDEVLKSTSQTLIIDTPPFLEARGLAQAIEDLNHFFKNPILAKGLKSNVLHSSFKKIFHFAQGFLGKLGVEQALEFLDWISKNAERFQKSTETLKDIFDRPDSHHSLVFSPETSKHQIESTFKFFKNCRNLQIIMNRSLKDLPTFSEDFASLHQEVQCRLKNEEKNEKLLKELFPQAHFARFPLQLMGEDSKEEMDRFLSTALKG